VPRRSKPDRLDPDAMIHYRPGETFGRLLARFAEDWQVTRNEAARRLALMSAYGLPADMYDLVARATEQLGGPKGFEQACHHLRGVLDGALMDRKQRKHPPMTADESRDAIEEAVRTLCDRFKAASTSATKKESGESLRGMSMS
jgi:hypothetical protein